MKYPSAATTPVTTSFVHDTRGSVSNARLWVASILEDGILTRLTSKIDLKLNHKTDGDHPFQWCFGADVDPVSSGWFGPSLVPVGIHEGTVQQHKTLSPRHNTVMAFVPLTTRTLVACSSVWLHTGSVVWTSGQMALYTTAYEQGHKSLKVHSCMHENLRG